MTIPTAPPVPQPEPGRPKKPWFAKWWVWVIAVLVLAGIGNALGGGSPQATPPPAVEVSPPATTSAPAEPSQAASSALDPLTLEKGWKADTSNPFAVFVSGYVANNTDAAISTYVQITFDALDAEGANVGTCLANTNTIDANGRWKFKAMCTGGSDEVAKVRFKEITGF